MRTLLLWEDCPTFDTKKRAYWVEAPLEVFLSEIQDVIPGSGPYVNRIDEHLESVAYSSKSEGLSGFIRENHVYLLVPEDGTAYQIYAPTMPLSGQWYRCPFVTYEREIVDLSCLSQLNHQEESTS